MLQCNYPSSFKENEYNLKLEYALTQTFSISIVRQGEGSLELREYVERFSFSVVFFLLRGVGTWICVDTSIFCFNGWGEWEHGYVLTQTFSFSIVR